MSGKRDEQGRGRRGGTLAFVLHLKVGIFKKSLSMCTVQTSRLTKGGVGSSGSGRDMRFTLKVDHRVLRRGVKEEGHFPSKEKVMAGRFREVLDIGESLGNLFSLEVKGAGGRKPGVFRLWLKGS